MPTIKTKTVYVTNDDQEFDTEAQAKEHETFLLLKTMLTGEFGHIIRDTPAEDVALWFADNRTKVLELLA